MKFSKSPITTPRALRPATMFCAGLLVLGGLIGAVAHAMPQSATTVANKAATTDADSARSATEISRWSDTVWNAARTGDMEAVEAALRNVPSSHAAAESQRIRDIVAARSQHVDADNKALEEARAKALEDLNAEVEKGEITKALTAAVNYQTLGDTLADALQVPAIQQLIVMGEEAADAAENAGDFFTAQELFYRLKTLNEVSDGETVRHFRARLDEVNQRIQLLAQYAPRELWAMRKAYAERVAPDKPYPEFNDATAEDWKESLDGISKGMVASALTTAANEHISAGGWEPLVQGGLRAIRVLATTSALKENFPGLADPEKARLLVEAVDRNLEELARADRRSIGRGNFNVALRDIMEANAKGPDLPLAVIYREFGDGAIGELAGRFEDEYSQVIWPDQLRRFEQMIKGNFVGVGIQIRHDDRREIQVVNPLEGGPAFRGGIENDDRIVAVDGKPTVGWTLNRAVDSITGRAGEEVTLSVKREGVDDPIDFKLVREQIKIRSVNGWWKKALDERGIPEWDWYIDPTAGIGYVRLTSFNDDSFDDFRAAIAQMRAERPLNGIILDLRFNPGGLLQSAIDFSNAFIDNGGIVELQDRDRRKLWGKNADSRRAELRDLPLVVLINPGSASASEIVSGAIKAHDHSVVIGERSFGKGSVQTVHPCGDGRSDAQLKLTTQYYVLPPGPGETEPRLVHKRPGSTDWGVNPDLVVKMTPTQIEKATMLRQEADVIEQRTARNGEEPKERPSVEDLIAKGLDPQLELALLVLQARALKDADAAAASAMADSAPKSGAAGG
ncbi:MAG: Carboxy-terminal processing protease CtpB precursor [Planctomycetota bacterium]